MAGTPVGNTFYNDKVLMEGWTDKRVENEERHAQVMEYTQRPYTATSVSPTATGLGWPVKTRQTPAADHFVTTQKAHFQDPKTQPVPDRPTVRGIRISPTQVTATTLAGMVNGESPVSQTFVPQFAASPAASPSGATEKLLTTAVDAELETAPSPVMVATIPSRPVSAAPAHAVTLKSTIDQEALRQKYATDNCFKRPAGKASYAEHPAF
uniref:Uncharacterized protein n=1 Tax=Chromera velia CCMP2878 TaxID=1169474 RepID=A0A0G4I3M8_9ALVE|mmetsp:Transcript_31671/g.62681  ORF Transcript_31671/g.62681 Transcript_31671/m.62681 type:complete len:210 (-) Transcript_31671:80-709(-)|eukprot:Cvel_10670.t1-p1 / transcript=Cvel_10670.t1 / gene=Cvel_10670 / organism=Chromera_velia_CCMP2878 / gene_product=hypothetical protein / transcript_product=hypothetical protein / location=Cvel_scaffold648:70842-71468(+) / protein_length=209 / sequence_SO=supercontig / SO=protein_coding / is_pseudo=false